MSAPKYKLTYFDVKARAEPTRMMFAAAGVKYVDERIKRDDWPTLKSTFPQEQLPVLTIDGKTTIVQSYAIARFVAREYNFYGKNNKESTQIDQIVDTLLDLLQCFRQVFLEKDETKKAELMKKVETEDSPKYLGYIEKLVEAFGRDGYSVGDSLSLADISIHVFTDFLQLKDKLDKFPSTTACIKKVEENKNIAKWLKERPVTER